MTDTQWHASSAVLAEFAFDPAAIDDMTAASIEAHLVTCPECRRQMTMTADPSPHLKEVWHERRDQYKAECSKRDKKPFVVMMRDGWVADTFEQAASTFGTHFVDEWKFYFNMGIFTGHPDLQTEADITPEKCAKHLIMGTPAQCIEQLEMFHEEYEVDYFTMRFRMPTGPSMEAALEEIQKFGEEVVQPIHRKYAAPDHPAISAACRW